MKIRLFLGLLLLSLGTFPLMAQTPTTQGRDFWVSYMKNGHRTSNEDRVTLIVSAKEDCVVTVSNTISTPPYTMTFPVNAGEVVIKPIADYCAYNSQNDGVANTGLHVTSDQDISLYIGNEADNSYDAANVLPTNALGTVYRIQTCNSVYTSLNNNSQNMRASFLVIATEDHTVLEITPKVATPNHPAGQTYTISLNRGQVYHVLTSNGSTTGNTNGDFSGTTIVANNPVSVFSGNCLVSIPGGLSTGYDHVFEQAMPTDYWGKRFVVTSSGFVNHGVGDDMVKITADLDNTDVLRDGSVLCHLRAGESFDFNMNLSYDPCTYLESNHPIAVYLYNHSHGTDNPQYCDPSMVWISPVEQTIEEVSFSSFQVQEVNFHYVNIVCYTDYVAEMTLDGVNIASSFLTVPGNSEFSYVRYGISHGSHTLSCPGGFVAYVYGIGEAEGYAYTVGSSAKVLTTQLFINGESYDNYLEGYTTCQNSEVQFGVEANFNIDHVSWLFGDGATGAGETVTHGFTEEGSYQVEAWVYHNAEDFDVLSAVIHVSPQIEIVVDYSTCNTTYHFHGQVFPVPCFDDFIVPGDEGCDTIYHMNIQSNPSVSAPPRYDTICEEGEGVMWFDTLRTEPGTYLVIAQTVEGCDSICLLHLEVDKVPENPERELSSCTPYHWGEDIVCDHTDVYYRTFLAQGGICEYDSVLYFTLLASPSFERIVGLSNVAVATNFWPGQYLYCLDDSTGISTGRVRWELMGNPEGPEHWELIPHGASCTVIAYSMGERVLWVSTGDGFCDKEAFKTINCTGYGVDENEIINLEIYPNPAKDELVVKGPEILELTIYNLLGQKMRSVATHGDTEVKMEVSDMPQALYLLEVRTPRGNKTRLVSVIN